MKKLVTCSGGLDSVSMAIIESAKHEVELMSFYYRQKGIQEINAVRTVADMLNVKLHEVDISFMADIFGKNQLTDWNSGIEEGYVPSVVVPLRNAMFLQIAMIYASVNDFDEVVLGCHLNDIEEVDGEMMYPDCSPEFLRACEQASKLGKFKSDKLVKVESASTKCWTKADLIEMASEINPDILFHTWSCYTSGVHHCGVCESCRNRKKAFEWAGIKDKTIYEN